MKKKFFISGLVVLTILSIVFIAKNLYPFGSDYLIWGDLHSQITAIYYNFYDIFHNGKSFLIDFSAGTATNLIATFAYYISSPFTFIVLLFERANIPYAVNIIVLLKFVLSAITFNIFIDKMFPKLSNYYKIFYSVIYALSTYSLSFYIITGWIDIVYLFPIMLLGLKKLLEEEKPTLYIVLLCISLINNFYISLMCIIFVFLSSIFYLRYKKSSDKKRKITLLGVSTVLGILISIFVLLPAYLQIDRTARMGFNFSEVMTSKTGPIIDKLLFLVSSVSMISTILLSIKEHKKNKKWLAYLLPILTLYLIPIIVEPTNKIMHFGSYMYYPLRFGFILNTLLIIGSCKYLETDKVEKDNYLIIPISVIMNILIAFITYRYYNILQSGVNKLTFSLNHKAFFIMVIIAFIGFINYLIIYIFSKKDSKTRYSLLTLSIIVFTLTQSLVYIKIDFDEVRLHNIYNDMHYIEKEEDKYHYKLNDDILINNYGLVINKPVQDYFTSLTDIQAFEAYQRLGYRTSAMNTSSIGSNYFIDLLLGNKYLISDKKIDDPIYKEYKDNNSVYLYKANTNVFLGYEVNCNVNLTDTSNSFEATNKIYSCVSEDKENIINIYNDFNYININNNNNKLEIIDTEKDAYLEKTIKIEDKTTIYFELVNSYMNSKKNKVAKQYNLYVNDKLYSKGIPQSINLGTYENQEINIKIKITKDIEYLDIAIGTLSIQKVEDFFNRDNNLLDLNYSKNKILIDYKTEEDNKTLLIPITKLNGMTLRVNNKEKDIITLYDNFIGIPLENGENTIEISYITPGLKLSIVISILSLIATVLFIRNKEIILNNTLINNIASWLYNVGYIMLLLIIYVIPFIIFVMSYVL